MYFSNIPDIKYDTKPVSYPFSESDYTTAKNFFRRYKVNDDIFGYSVLYNKMSVEDGQTLPELSYALYGDPFYDWIIVLSNNMVNPGFSLPLDNYTLTKLVEFKYGDDAYSGIHHYETIEKLSGETLNGKNIIALKGDLVVDYNFYTSPFSYWNGTSTVTIPGNNVSRPVTNQEYEVTENEKKREIFVLKSSYLVRFVEDFKTSNLYNSDCSDFITKRLKKTGV